MKIKQFWRVMSEELGGDPPAGAGGGGGEPPTSTGQEGGIAQPPATDATPDWAKSIDQGLQEYAQKKGFKEPGEALKALQEMEGKNAVPDSVDGYELPVPEGDNGEFAKQAAGWMHEAGIPAEAAKALAGKWNQHVADMQKSFDTQRQQQDETDVSTLKKEWGGQYDANTELGRRAVRTFVGQGDEAADVVEKLSQALGSAETLRLFHRIGKHLGEGSLSPDGGSSDKHTGANKDPLGDMAARMYPDMK